jgi:hypothetical protein
MCTCKNCVKGCCHAILAVMCLGTGAVLCMLPTSSAQPLTPPSSPPHPHPPTHLPPHPPARPPTRAGHAVPAGPARRAWAAAGARCLVQTIRRAASALCQGAGSRGEGARGRGLLRGGGGSGAGGAGSRMRISSGGWLERACTGATLAAQYMRGKACTAQCEILACNTGSGHLKVNSKVVELS